ncbi:hypothetical protein AAVH_28726, partial [Aphelenchoides avenae]
VDIAGFFFPFWQLFEIISASAKNKGHISNRLHWTDGTNWVPSRDKMDEFWSVVPVVGDPRYAAQMGYEVNVEELRVAEIFSNAELDQIETAALLMLVFVHYGSTLFETRDSRKACVDRVLAELRAHYQFTGKEFVDRLDRITRVLGEFHTASRVNLETQAAYDLVSPAKTFCIVDGYRHWRACRDRIHRRGRRGK